MVVDSLNSLAADPRLPFRLVQSQHHEANFPDVGVKTDFRVYLQKDPSLPTIMIAEMRSGRLPPRQHFVNSLFAPQRTGTHRLVSASVRSGRGASGGRLRFLMPVQSACEAPPDLLRRRLGLELSSLPSPLPLSFLLVSFTHHRPRRQREGLCFYLSSPATPRCLALPASSVLSRNS